MLFTLFIVSDLSFSRVRTSLNSVLHGVCLVSKNTFYISESNVSLNPFVKMKAYMLNLFGRVCSCSFILRRSGVIQILISNLCLQVVFPLPMQHNKNKLPLDFDNFTYLSFTYLEFYLSLVPFNTS